MMRARGAAEDMWLLMGRTVHDAEDTDLGAPTKINHKDQPGPFGDGSRREEQSMKKLVTSATLIAVLSCATAALAHGSTVRVSGIQAPPDTTAGAPGDPCAALDPATGAPAQGNVMAGSLIGCWYTDTFTPIISTPSGLIVATGAEHFVGCLDVDRTGRCAHRDPTGVLAFTYKFEGRFDPAGNEIAGRCQHKVVSGTGDFAGATGRIDFKDNVTNKTAKYRGHITLTDRHGVTVARAAAAADAAVSRPSSIC